MDFLRILYFVLPFCFKEFGIARGKTGPKKRMVVVEIIIFFFSGCKTETSHMGYDEGLMSLCIVQTAILLFFAASISS